MLKQFLNAFKMCVSNTELEKICIPNVIHFIWLGSGLSDSHKKNIKTWLAYNPDYSFNLWIDSATIWLETVKTDLADINKFCVENKIFLHDINKEKQFYDFVRSYPYHDLVCGEDKCFAFAADQLRLQILYLYGGVYTDIDTYCVDSLGDLANNVGFFVWGKKIDTCFIASSKQHYIIGECITENSKDHQLFLSAGDSVNEYYKYRLISSINMASRIGTFSALPSIKCIGNILKEHSLFDECIFLADVKVIHNRDNTWKSIEERSIGMLGLDNNGNELKLTEKNMAFARKYGPSVTEGVNHKLRLHFE